MINIFGFKTKRLSRRSTFALLALGLIAAVPLASSLSLTDKQIPGLSEIASALSIINGRSPGERITGELTKAKPAQLAGIRTERGARRIIPARSGAPQDLPQDLTLPLAQFSPELPESGFEDAPSPGYQLAALGSPFIPGTGGGGTGFPSVSGPIGGGAGGGNGDNGDNGDNGLVGDGPPDNGSDDPAPVLSPVPEPGTWAMMLIGFGLCGAALRRRRARAETRPAPQCVAT